MNNSCTDSDLLCRDKCIYAPVKYHDIILAVYTRVAIPWNMVEAVHLLYKNVFKFPFSALTLLVG